MKAMPMVVHPQRNMMQGRKMEGFVRARIMLSGINEHPFHRVQPFTSDATYLDGTSQTT